MSIEFVVFEPIKNFDLWKYYDLDAIKNRIEPLIHQG
ncbi:hypothetical protein SAMN04489761_3545 [Tenacibaculum sp. MAR_2009_124]|nr:hypothetical protein SAMN04489761_3545 [Tenacibaculum sp. MAR_2009_124]